MIKYILISCVFVLCSCKGDATPSVEVKPVNTPSEIAEEAKSEVSSDNEISEMKSKEERNTVDESKVISESKTNKKPVTSEAKPQNTVVESPTSIDVETSEQVGTVIEQVKNVTKPIPSEETKEEVIITKVAENEEEATVIKTIKEEMVELNIHESWNILLQKHVTATGAVDYASFKKNETALDKYLTSLQENTPENAWSRDKTMAFWINAYNAFTIKLILKNWPVKSIMDINGGKAWDLKWIEMDGKTLTLNNIEHDILRANYKDARIHFAVNCAAKSCPPVWNQAWTAENLESTLEAKTKAFVNNTAYNSIGADEVNVSKIFEWYAADFGDILNYLKKYSNTSINKNAQLNYKEYNWALNK